MRTFLHAFVITAFTTFTLLTGCGGKKASVKDDMRLSSKKVIMEKEEDKKTADYESESGLKRDRTKVDEEDLTRGVDSDNLKDEKIAMKKFDSDSDKSDEELEKEAIEKQDSLAELQKVYFDYDKSSLRDDALDALKANADILKSEKSAEIIIEGHCDERGTEEYNLALGQRRAESVKEYLSSLGITSTRLTTISYGEAKPEVEGNDESAWKWNRRAILKTTEE